MRYREANRLDAVTIADLHAESWRRFYRGAYRDDYLDGDVRPDRRRVWNERLATVNPSQFVLLAEDSVGLAGFVCAYGNADPKWGTLLDNLHVNARIQGEGVGARLVSEVGDWCRRTFTPTTNAAPTVL